MRVTVFVLIAIFFVAGVVLAQSPNDVLTQKLSRRAAESKFPGFCVCVVKNDKLT